MWSVVYPFINVENRADLWFQRDSPFMVSGDKS